jgi:hypothetical protein
MQLMERYVIYCSYCFSDNIERDLDSSHTVNIEGLFRDIEG